MLLGILFGKRTLCSCITRNGLEEKVSLPLKLSKPYSHLNIEMVVWPTEQIHVIGLALFTPFNWAGYFEFWPLACNYANQRMLTTERALVILDRVYSL